MFLDCILASTILTHKSRSANDFGAIAGLSLFGGLLRLFSPSVMGFWSELGHFFVPPHITLLCVNALSKNVQALYASFPSPFFSLLCHSRIARCANRREYSLFPSRANRDVSTISCFVWRMVSLKEVFFPPFHYCSRGWQHLFSVSYPNVY